MSKLQVHAHNMVASVAVNAAYESYEVLMANNQLFSAWKAKHPGASAKGLALAYVKRYAESHIPIARATLAALLTSPTISEDYKESIVEALALDASLQRGRMAGAEVIGTTTETEN